MQDDQPNGLVQTEVSKKITLLSQRSQFFALNYIEPIISFSKIDQNNRTLNLDSNTSALDMFQYTNFRSGLNLNLLGFSIPNAKIHFEIDGGINLFRTNIIGELDQDTGTQDTTNQNSLGFSGSLQVKFRPDTRYGLELAYLFSEFNPTNKSLGIEADWLHTFSLYGFFSPERLRNNSIYLNIRLNTDKIDEFENNFVQIQLGYSFPLTIRTNKDPKEKT